jgi:cysteine synthase
MSAFFKLLELQTPLLRWGPALLKLELLRPTGGTEDRALALLTRSGVLEANAGAALAAAAWAKARGLRIAIRPRGIFTHEVRETLRIWGTPLTDARPDLPALDSDEAAPLYTLDLPDAPAVVAPAGARAALLSSKGRRIALVAADQEMPDLPRASDFKEVRAIKRAEAAEARRRLARETGVLASHASAAAALVAREIPGAVALLTAAGEREFSLEGAP